MTAEWKQWRRGDIIYGILAPVLVVLLVLLLSQLGSLLGGGRGGFGLVMGITSGISEAILIVVVPLLLGLAWNKWAGGASGFLLGSLYALYWRDSFMLAAHRGDVSLLGYVLSAMLIGYVAGALNNRSESLWRMVISGLVATTIGGLLLFGIYQLAPIPMVYGLFGFAITMLPRIACGVLIPIIAKVFMWYGVSMHKS